MSGRASPAARPHRAGDKRKRLERVADRLLGFRFAEGRVAPGELAAPARLAARFGICALVVLLAFLAARPLLPGGHAVVPSAANPTALPGVSVPGALVPLSYIVLAAAWALILVGCAYCRPAVRVLAGLGFALTANNLVFPVGSGAGLGHSTVLDQHLVAALFFLTLAALVASSLGARLGWSPVLSRAFAVGAGLVAAAMHVLALVVYVDNPAAGPRAFVVQFLVALVIQLGAPLLLLLLLATLAVVRLGYGIGEVGARAVSGLGRYWGRYCVVAVVGAEAVFLGWRQRGTYLGLWHRHPEGVLLALAMGWLLAVLAVAFRHLHAAPSEIEREHVGGYAAVAATLPNLVDLVLVGLYGLFSTDVMDLHGLSQAFYDARYAADTQVALQDWVPIVLWSGVFVRALQVAGRSRAPRLHRQAAVGFAAIALWQLVIDVVYPPHEWWSPPSLRVLALAIAACVLVYLAVNWRSVTAPQCGVLVGITVLSWLVASEGAALDLLGRLVHLSGNVLTVAGVVLTLLGGAGFTRLSGRLFPREGRLLLFLGYLLVSVLADLWLQDVKGLGVYYTWLSDPYLYLGAPYAIWLVVDRRFRPARSARPVPLADAPSSERAHPVALVPPD